MSRASSNYHNGHPRLLILATLTALLLASLPVSLPIALAWQHSSVVDSLAYKQKYGHWDVLSVPKDNRINTIHAALLPTGKVLLVAGSGNNRTSFNTYDSTGAISVLKTMLYDPETDAFTNIPTPSDLFCSGHAMLQSGNLLVAGGTVGYEQLEGSVTKPAGKMIIHNEDPDDKARVFKKGSTFTDAQGRQYLSTADVTLQPAHEMIMGGKKMIMHSSATVFVEAAKADKSYVTSTNQHYTINGLSGVLKQNIYGQGGPMTLDKQDYRGDDKSYEFDPWTERYERVGDMNVGRWYPSLPVLTNGDVVAVSGLDNTGQITKTTETFSDYTKKWTLGQDQAFATYPALFRTTNPDVLFFSGSNAGYGPVDEGRTPGFWNIKDNTFRAVGGLRDTDLTETSASVMLPPTKGSNDGSQSTRIMIAGGGGIGESNQTTARTDIIDLSGPSPKYVPGPDLTSPLRYVNMTVLPNDKVLTSGGTGDYRAKGNSYSFTTTMIDPTDGTVTKMADELVGRSYHSGSLLLPNGKVLVFGNDPLYSDIDNTITGSFEQRIELYTPPELFASTRPTLGLANGTKVTRGQVLTVPTSTADSIHNARLIPLSTTTHVTNIEQRSVGVIANKADSSNVSITINGDRNVLPNGWYMLYAVDANGTYSKAVMVQVVE